MSAVTLRVHYAHLMFCVREKYWHHGEVLCSRVIQAHDDWLFRVWRALCYDQQGMTTEAMREYKSAEQHRETTVAARMGMLLLYKRSRDEEGVQSMDGKLRDERARTDVAGWLQAAAMCAACNDVNAARDILLAQQDVLSSRASETSSSGRDGGNADFASYSRHTRSGQQQSQQQSKVSYRDEYTDYETVRGWVDLRTGRGALLEKCGAFFQSVLDRAAREGGEVFATSVESSSFSSSPAGTAAAVTVTAAVDIDAALGRVAYLERKYQLFAAQELLNQVIVQFPTFTPALVVKARLLMHAEDWEQAMETVHRVLDKDAHSMEALTLAVTHALVKEARYSAAAGHLETLHQVMQSDEPRNAELAFHLAQTFGRLAGGNLSLLVHTMRLAEAATILDSRDGEYLCEVGYQQMYREDYHVALATLHKAATLTDSLSPLQGAAMCLIQLGRLTEAGKQVAFCNELQVTNQRSAELSLLNGMLASRGVHTGGSSSSSGSGGSHAANNVIMVTTSTAEDARRALHHLDDAAEIMRHEIELSQSAGEAEFYARLNVPLMLHIAREYVRLGRSEPPAAHNSSRGISSSNSSRIGNVGKGKSNNTPQSQPSDAAVERCQQHLSLLLRHMPGCVEGQLLLARVCFVLGNLKQAETIIQSTMTVEQPLSEAYLLSAQICHYTLRPKLASQALDYALTLDFEMKDQPQYNLLHGIVLSQNGQKKEALEAFLTAMQLMAASSEQSQTSQTAQASASRSTGRPIKPLSLNDHVTLYLQTAQAHLALRDTEEARLTLRSAATLFIHTAEAGRVSIAQAMLTARSDVEKAIELLRQILPSSMYYVTARTQMAKMYLVQLHNPAQYVKCFEEVVEQVATAQSYMELGEAYSIVQAPERAIDAYQKAKALDPNNSDLAVRIGRSFVATHDYEKAIHYYIDALFVDASLFDVRADLAMLLWHLGDTFRAEQILYEAPHHQTEMTDSEPIESVVQRVNLWLLLYKMFRRSDGKTGGSGGSGGADRVSDAGHALLQARQAQMRLLDQKLQSETRETMRQQKYVLATIDVELARFYLNHGVACITDSNANSTTQDIKTTSSRNNRDDDGVASSSRHGTTATSLSWSARGMNSGTSYSHNSVLEDTAEAVSESLAKARECLSEALRFDETNEPAMLELARVHLRAGDLDAADVQCQTLLRMSPDHTAATLLRADIALRRGNDGVASALYEALLLQHPEQYDVLVRYTQVMCRAGELTAARAFVESMVERHMAIHALPLGSNDNISDINTSSVASVPSTATAASSRVMVHSPRTASTLPPGVNYARGWVLRCSNSNAEALRVFNLARFPPDNPWSVKAVTQMIEIYLVPSSTEDLWVSSRDDKNESSLSSATSAGAGGQTWSAVEDKGADNVSSAEQLLLQLPAGEARQMLQAYCLLAHRRRAEMERAVSIFLAVIGKTLLQSGGCGSAVVSPRAVVASEDDEDDKLIGPALRQKWGKSPSRSAETTQAQSTGTGSAATLTQVLEAPDSLIHTRAYFGLAMSLFMSHQQTVAGKVLERLLHAPADPECADVVERAMLLRAHLEERAGQSSVAQATLESVLRTNKSCGVAWYALGSLHEREQKHAEASSCYEKAWKLVQENDPAVGYKLSFNYLKADNPVRAMDVARKVLLQNPDYPRIEKDVIEVAYTMIRS